MCELVEVLGAIYPQGLSLDSLISLPQVLATALFRRPVWSRIDGNGMEEEGKGESSD